MKTSKSRAVRKIICKCLLKKYTPECFTCKPCNCKQIMWLPILEILMAPVTLDPIVSHFEFGTNHRILLL